MAQSNLASFTESFINVSIGYAVALCTQLIVFPLYGFDVTISEQLSIGLIFTCISLARMYIIRRFFNAY